MARDSYDDVELKEISASDILDKIQKGEPVEYDCVRIIGDLDIGKLVLPAKHLELTELQRQMGLAEEAKIVGSAISITNSVVQGNFDFRNAAFSEHICFEGVKFKKNCTFLGTAFEGASFRGTTFSEGAWFDCVTFGMDALFHRANFAKGSLFEGANFCKLAEFHETEISGYADFKGATFDFFAEFSDATFGDDAVFQSATFKNSAAFVRANFNGNVSFSNATFKWIASFNGAKFKGEYLTFRDATFALSNSQEDACRIAKNILSKGGDRDEEDYHFYREMEAKRKQRGIYEVSLFPDESFQTLKAENFSIIWRLLWYNLIEYIFIQKMFGYGVHPKRLIFSWGAIVLAFGFIYWHGNGLIGPTDCLDYFKVSFATAIAPGFIAAIINPDGGGYRLVSTYQLVAMIETVVGTFLWAGFIATFAKKYMR